MEWFDKNSAAIIAASAALIASFIAGSFALLGAWLNHVFSNKRYKEQKYHDSAKDNKRLYLDKGEELHSLLTLWGNTAFSNFLGDRGFIAGKLTREQANELLIKDSGLNVYQRIKTLMDIYFSELAECFDSARAVALKAGDITDSFSRGDLSSLEAFQEHESCTSEFLPLLTKIQNELQLILLKQLEA